MFKALKRLFSKVEQETEAALGGEIEAELARAREQARAGQAAPGAPAPPPAVPSPPTPAPSPPPETPKEAATPPESPVPPAAPVTARPPSGYKEAKRLGALEEAQRKKETIEDRLARELGEAVEQQRAIEQVVGAESGRILLPPNKLEDLLWELEVGLLESDVALPVIEAVKSSVREQLTTIGVSRDSPSASVEQVLRTAIRKVLNVGRLSFDEFVRNKLKQKKPVVVMFVGVNGTGKTTSIAKIAHRLQKAKLGCVMAAGDTFRAGAIEQLSLHGDRLGVKVIKHSAGSDPAAVAYDAIEHAKSRAKEVVLLDTAGRMQTNTNLMEEMAKIRRVARPDLVVFVGDSLAGNDAVEQAREFNKVVGIDGVILTKVDADAKGGAALSVAYTIGKPLLFIGVGQGYDDQVPFDPDWMVDRLFAKDEEAQAAA